MGCALAMVLRLSEELEQARLTFEKMFTYANHLGLYAEEIGLTGGSWATSPRPSPTLSLINAAITLNDQLDHDAGTDPVVGHAPASADR